MLWQHRRKLSTNPQHCQGPGNHCLAIQNITYNNQNTKRKFSSYEPRHCLLCKRRSKLITLLDWKKKEEEMEERAQLTETAAEIVGCFYKHWDLHGMWELYNMINSSILQLIQHPTTSLGYLSMLSNCNNIYLAHMYKKLICD